VVKAGPRQTNLDLPNRHTAGNAAVTGLIIRIVSIAAPVGVIPVRIAVRIRVVAVVGVKERIIKTAEEEEVIIIKVATTMSSKVS
jgi:hypothetical protein